MKRKHTHTMLYLVPELLLSQFTNMLYALARLCICRIRTPSHTQKLLPCIQSLMNFPQSCIKLANQGAHLRLCVSMSMYEHITSAAAGSILPQTKASPLNWALVDCYPVSSLALDLVWGGLGKDTLDVQVSDVASRLHTL